MKQVETVERIVSNLETQLLALKARQSVSGRSLQLQENISNQFSTTISAFGLATIRIVYTPNNTVNQYAELGIQSSYIPYSAYNLENIVRDPSTSSNSTTASWLVYASNGTGTANTYNLICSVVALSAGTVTITRAS